MNRFLRTLLPRVTLAAASAALGVLIAASAAQASTTASYFPDGSSPPPGASFGLLIQGDALANNATVRMLERDPFEANPVLAEPFRFRVFTLGPSVVAGQGCSSVTTTAGDAVAECNIGASTRVTASLAGGNDTLAETTRPELPLFGILIVEGGDGNDQISGDRGKDDLRGGAGSDILRGFDGKDIHTGGAGTDLIDSRDGVGETVNCGSPSGVIGDRAQVDLFDKTLDCETIERFATDDGPPGAPRGRLRIQPDGVAAVRIACPRKALVACSGQVSVRDPRRRQRVLGTASYTIGLGKTREVDLRLSPAESTLLRQRGRALVTTREQGRSRKGPRSAQATLGIAG